ncbi:MAG: SusC/RagA family TonB-linked outer membrane protein [Bacteroidales bacterium]|nr:SusC/RagA family TonB-linked outer membrane protein [Bacteroidales bacterium]
MKPITLKRTIVTAFLSLMCFVFVQAQNVKVTGTVIDESGQPVIGAGVFQKGSTNGVVTDFDGVFELNVPEGTILVFSSVSYVTQELPAKQNMKVTLVEDHELLDEVVVIGYGTTRSKNFTGSVDVLKMEDSPISNLGVSGASDLLRNRMSGVVMSSESGTAGSNSSMLVRGRKSIGSTTNEPLIILDGVIFAGNMNDIDPNSIESISVLKDATSLAAFGSKAAQGAIMITSKKGKVGKPIFNFSTSQEFQTPSYKPKYADGEGYIRYRNAKIGEDDLTNTSWMSYIEKENYKNGKTVDWYDLSSRTGQYQTYSFNMSGATDNINYYVGAGHNIMEGMAVGNIVYRTNLSTNLSAKIFPFLQVGINANYTQQRDPSVSANIGGVRQSPYGEPYLPDGRVRKYIEGEDNTATNPLWSALSGATESESVRKNLMMGGFIRLDIPWVKGLNFRINGSYNQTLNTSQRFTHESDAPALLAYDWEGIGYSEKYYNLSSPTGSSSFSQSVNWVIDNILSYNKSFGDHYVSGSLVYTRDSAESVAQSYNGSDFSTAGNTLLGWYGLGNAASKQFTSPSYSLHTDIGFLGRIIYSFKNTYHLNVSLRRDGSSVFGSEKKWGNFPAIGGAWTISNEKFMKNISWLNNLKLKLSWGQNGAQTISPYGTLSTIDLAKGGAIYNYYDGAIHWGQKISALGNPTLGWQTTTSWNGGFESDVLGARIHTDLNLYYSKTTDQIFEKTIPIMTAGISRQKATMGQVDNKGIELNVTSDNIKTEDFNWNTGIVFSLNRNKLVELDGSGEDNINDNLFIGRPLGTIFDYKVGGINVDGPNAGSPYFIDKDGNKTDNPSADDRQFLGNSNENFRLSMSNTFRYKNLQLYIMFNGVFGGNGYALANNTFAYQTYNVQNRVNCLDIPFWTKDNPSSEYPAANYKNSQDHYHVYNSFGFVRLQDLSLSYNLSKFVKKYNINSARVSITGRNLFVIAPNWKLSDPESRGESTIGLPRALTLSLNLSF